MSHDSQHHQNAPAAPPVDEGASRLANLLVGGTAALLLIVLAVVVALA